MWNASLALQCGCSSDKVGGRVVLLNTPTLGIYLSYARTDLHSGSVDGSARSNAASLRKRAWPNIHQCLSFNHNEYCRRQTGCSKSRRSGILLGPLAEQQRGIQ